MFYVVKVIIIMHIMRNKYILKQISNSSMISVTQTYLRQSVMWLCIFFITLFLDIECIYSWSYSNKWNFCRLNRIINMAVNDDDKVPLNYRVMEDDLKPKFNIRSLDDLEEEKRQARSGYTKEQETERTERKAATAALKSKQYNSKVFGAVDFEELYYRSGGSSRRFKTGNIKKEDLNGVEPSIPFIFATVPIAMCAMGYQISVFLAQHFAIQYVDSEVYPVQRLAIVGRNFVVGIVTLATGFSGVIALGLIIMGIAVTIGVAKGELDPKKKEESGEAANKNSIPL